MKGFLLTFLVGAFIFDCIQADDSSFLDDENIGDDDLLDFTNEDLDNGDFSSDSVTDSLQTAENDAMTNSTDTIGCAPGTFFSNGANNKCAPCPAGTFSSVSNILSEKSCQKCTPGSFCPPGSSSAAKCSAGFFCVTPNKSAKCPKGSYCRAGSINPTTCPPGTYNSVEGASTPEQCLQCGVGFHCFGNKKQNPCTPGQLCRQASLALPILCPSGFYCPNPVKAAVACPVGHYCSPGLASPIPCPAGMYNPETKQPKCLPCPLGAYCPRGMKTAPDRTVNLVMTEMNRCINYYFSGPDVALYYQKALNTPPGVTPYKVGTCKDLGFYHERYPVNTLKPEFYFWGGLGHTDTMLWTRIEAY